MTDFLVIAGIVIPVVEGSFHRNARDRGGSESFSYNGTPRSTVRWEKDSWVCTAGEMLASELATLLAAVANDVPVAVTGQAITASCRVTVGQTTVVTAQTSDANHWIVSAALTIRVAT